MQKHQNRMDGLFTYYGGGKPSEIVSVCLDSGQLGCARLKGRMNPHPRRYCEEEHCKQGGERWELWGNIFKRCPAMSCQGKVQIKKMKNERENSFIHCCVTSMRCVSCPDLNWCCCRHLRGHYGVGLKIKKGSSYRANRW